MDATVFEALVRPEMGGLVLALYAVGFALKKIKKFPDEMIPLVILVIGLAGACGILQEITADAMIQGIACAMAAVFGNQIVKQAQKAAEKKAS